MNRGTATLPLPGETDYFLVNKDGIMSAVPLLGFDDLRFPATAINPPGAVNDPGFDATNGGWLFDAVATEVLFLIVQMPHSWKEGTSIEPHIHWQKTTSDAGPPYQTEDTTRLGNDTTELS